MGSPWTGASVLSTAVNKMDHGGCLLWSLCFCFILFYPALFHPADRDLFVSELSPYNSVHGPEQIHIAYGDSPRQMTVLWSTSSVQELASSFVHYGLAPKNYSMKAEGKFVLFTEGNPSGLQYVHRVLLEVRNRFIKNAKRKVDTLHLQPRGLAT